MNTTFQHVLKVWKLGVDCLCVLKYSNFKTFKFSNLPTLKPCCFANFIILQKSKPHNLKSVTMESFLVPILRPTNTYSWAKASTWRNPKSWAETTFENMFSELSAYFQKDGGALCNVWLSAVQSAKRRLLPRAKQNSVTTYTWAVNPRVDTIAWQCDSMHQTVKQTSRRHAKTTATSSSPFTDTNASTHSTMQLFNKVPMLPQRRPLHCARRWLSFASGPWGDWPRCHKALRSTRSILQSSIFSIIQPCCQAYSADLFKAPSVLPMSYAHPSPTYGKPYPKHNPFI